MTKATSENKQQLLSSSEAYNMALDKIIEKHKQTSQEIVSQAESLVTMMLDRLLQNCASGVAELVDMR